MAEIPKEMLNHMKCCECKQVISCPPVYSKRNGDNTCGRCVVSRNIKKRASRNKLFEQVALLLLFPCRYQNNGCESQLKWGESQEHEKCCNYGAVNMIHCPALTKVECTWQGSDKELYEHFEHEHSSLIVNHPFTIHHHLEWIVADMKRAVRTSYRNLLMKAYEFLFLLQFLICFQTDTIYVSIKFLGNEKLSPHFTGLFEFDKQTAIVAEGPCSFYCATRNPINVTQVLSKKSVFNERHSLKIPFHKKCNLMIVLNNIKCMNCNHTFSKLTSEQIRFCCAEWKFERNEKSDPEFSGERCMNYDKGCLYFDTTTNMTKHEVCLCKYSTYKCRMCNLKIEKGISYTDHLIKNHVFSRFCGAIDLTNIRTKINEKLTGLLQTGKGKFVCQWDISDDINHQQALFVAFGEKRITFSLKVISDLPASEDNNCGFKIHFLCSKTGKEVHRVLEKSFLNMTLIPIWKTEFQIDASCFTSNHLIYSFKIEMVN